MTKNPSAGSSDSIVCPYCHHAIKADTIEGDADEIPVKRECGYCGKAFESWGQIDITYRTRGLE